MIFSKQKEIDTVVIIKDNIKSLTCLFIGIPGRFGLVDRDGEHRTIEKRVACVCGIIYRTAVLWTGVAGCSIKNKSSV